MNKMSWVPFWQFLETLRGEGKNQRVIYGKIKSDYLNVILADFTSVKIPLSMFAPTPMCQPNFDDFEILDYGQTFRFGKYEASVDGALKDLLKEKGDH